MSRLKAIMPVLRVADMQRSVDWYSGLLGFQVVWRAPGDGDGENCLLRADAVELMLSTGSHLGSEPKFTGTLYFETEKVAALFERLKDRVQLVWPLEVMNYGTREFGIRDPDGYMLAFAEDASE